MEFWISEKPQLTPHSVFWEDGVFFLDTPSYLRYAFPFTFEDAEGIMEAYFSVYWMRLTEYDYFVATCWKSFFDTVETLCAHPKVGAGVQQSIAAGWPLFTQLRHAGIVGLGADRLIQFIDPDDGSLVWLLGKVLGNAPLANVDDLFTGRSAEAWGWVVDTTWNMLSEVGDGDMTRLPRFFENINKSASDHEGEQLLAFLKSNAGLASNVLSFFNTLKG